MIQKNDKLYQGTQVGTESIPKCKKVPSPYGYHGIGRPRKREYIRVRDTQCCICHTLFDKADIQNGVCIWCAYDRGIKIDTIVERYNYVP